MEVEMNQRSFALIILLVVVFGFGGLILWDARSNGKLGNEEEQKASNWEWENDWEGVEAPDQENEKPDRQIIASNYADAIAESGKYGMPIFVYFEADWCDWCKKMKSEALSDSKVKEIMKNYVVVYVDTDQNRDLAREFEVRVVPAYAITNCEEAKLKSGEGFKEADEFIPWLEDSTLYEQPKKEQDAPKPEEKPDVKPHNPSPPEPEEDRRFRPFRDREDRFFRRDDGNGDG
jgi:thiol:disulfide interchange protein